MTRFIRFMFYLSLAYVLTFLIFSPPPQESTQDIHITFPENIIPYEIAELSIKNTTSEDIVFTPCSEALIWIEQSVNGVITKTPAFGECSSLVSLPSQRVLSFSVNADTFKELQNIGEFTWVVSYDNKRFTKNFQVTEQGFFSKTFEAFVKKPLYNTLLYIAYLIPGHSLALSIIILTFLLRLLLFIPNYKAIKNQQAMQAMQPKLDFIKKQHAQNPQKIAEETMKLWKSSGVNPLGSCLPILLQLPVLLAMFFVLQQPISYVSHLVYPQLYGISLELNSLFLGINIQEKGTIILAIIVAFVQWFQMKDSLPKQENTDDFQQQMQQMMKIMFSILPFFVGILVITLPAGVGLYWVVSSIIGIIQSRLMKKTTDASAPMIL